MIAYGQNEKKHALWGIYQATKVGTSTQIDSLVTQGCVYHIPTMLVPCDGITTPSAAQSDTTAISFSFDEKKGAR